MSLSSGCKYYAICSLARSFACTANFFACSELIASLAHSSAPPRSNIWRLILHLFCTVVEGCFVYRFWRSTWIFFFRLSCDSSHWCAACFFLSGLRHYFFHSDWPFGRAYEHPKVLSWETSLKGFNAKWRVSLCLSSADVKPDIKLPSSPPCAYIKSNRLNIFANCWGFVLQQTTPLLTL